MQPKKISFFWENFTFLIMILFSVCAMCMWDNQTQVN